MKTVKDVHTPGVRTSEFWVSIAAMALPVLLPLLEKYAGHFDAATWQGMLASAIVAAGYAISRGLAKQNVPLTSKTAGGDLSDLQLTAELGEIDDLKRSRDVPGATFTKDGE